MHALRCYRCGASLAKLSLPLSRHDQCPECGVDLRVCRMCRFYDPGLPDQCAEDDADDVHEKARANFCDYFAPSESAFAPGRMTAHRDAEAELESLFDTDERATPGRVDTASSSTTDDTLRQAESLFKK
jgi:hypothetical protein